MLRAFLLASLGGALAACTVSHSNDELCIQQGVFPDGVSMSIAHFQFDSVQFSDGNMRYLLQGGIQVDNQVEDYSILLAEHPGKGGMCTVLSSTFSIQHSSEYSCYVYRGNDDLLIEWQNPTKRLWIKNRMVFTSEH